MFDYSVSTPYCTTLTMIFTHNMANTLESILQDKYRGYYFTCLIHIMSVYIGVTTLTGWDNNATWKDGVYEIGLWLYILQ
jgi:hypothetical protein